MRTTLQSVSILVFLLFSIQAEAFQETEWYWIYHASGCVPLSEMYREIPYFTGARTPQDMLEKVRTAKSGEDIHSGFSPILPIRAGLKPFTEMVAKTPDVYQIYKDPRITRTNAVALVVREEPQDFVLFFFRGDLCNALFGSGPE
jgi:hypothetical protein